MTTVIAKQHDDHDDDNDDGDDDDYDYDDDNHGDADDPGHDDDDCDEDSFYEKLSYTVRACPCPCMHSLNRPFNSEPMWPMLPPPILGAG